MPDITFRGYSKYHDRNVCSVSFNNEFENIRFQGAFNSKYRAANVQAEPSGSKTITNIVYTNEITEEQIRNVIRDLY